MYLADMSEGRQKAAVPYDHEHTVTNDDQNIFIAGLEP